MLNRILRHKKEREVLKQDVKSMCQNESIPLPERWELFTMSEMGDHNSCYPIFEVLNEIFDTDRLSWYDEFGAERYSTVNMIDIVETGMEEWDEYYEKEKPTEKQINRLKEEILQKFIKSFIFDW